jgi:hypothetical protein
MKVDLPLDGTARETLHEASRVLCGNMHVLEAILAIGQAENERFYQAGLADAIDCKANQAGTVIDKLLALRVVEPVPREPGQARDYHRRVPSQLWESLATYAAELLATPAQELPNLADRRQP